MQVEAADLGRDDESDALNERGLRARLGIERDVAAGRGEASNRAPTELYRKAVPVGLGAVSFGQAS